VRAGLIAAEPMSFVTGLRCVICGTLHPPETCETCPACGEEGILDFEYDYEAAARSLNARTLAARLDSNLWRYRELLPLADNLPPPPLVVGQTPLVPAAALARHLGLASLALKDDGRNPTGSFKDRASAVAVAKAQEQGSGILACSSTGNAASSLAGLAAASGLRSVIFIPASTPEPKLAQLLVFGATVLRVRGSYFDAFQLCQRTCRAARWYNRNCAINPALVEGKKTAGHEIGEQSGAHMPDWVAVSVGDGCTLAGLWKGLREMHLLGVIPRLPRMLGVQAEGAAPITTAFVSGAPVRPVEACTVADSIRVGAPRNWRKALNAIRESGGAMIDVSDEEILAAVRNTGRLAGVFAEPAAATAVAGLGRAVSTGAIDRGSSALAVITGSGLKDTRAILSIVGQPFDVEPDGGGVEEILRERRLA
jgi:threonine synthase